MLRRKAMAAKHIQISRNCIRKAKRTSDEKKRTYWINLAERQLAQAKEYIKTLD